MNIGDNGVIDKLNTFIMTNRFNKSQILQLVKLVSISNNFKDLKENLEWETSSKKS